MDNFTQLWESLLPIGRHPGTGGYRRYAWTPADAQCRAWFVAEATARDLAVETDRNGNLWAWWSGPGPGAVVTGSHLDSVPDGGAYDGPLGVVSAFAAIDALREGGIGPRRPIAVVAFADEEGARFGVSCVGSRLLTGVLAPERARELRDGAGVSLAEAMDAAGHDPADLGRDDERLALLDTFVELHIEQGRGLVDLDAPVGVGSAIWPHGRWRFDLTGVADHAGTTRLDDRRDPMLPLAAGVLAARELAARAGAVATVGKVRVEPNGTNAVPSAVQAWLDARAPGEQAVRELADAVARRVEAAADAHGVRLRVELESWTGEVAFDPELRDRLAWQLTPPGGTPLPVLPTGAGHDAGILAPAVSSAMLFVRNPTGVSHSPHEYAAEADCRAGVAALATALEELACR